MEQAREQELAFEIEGMRCAACVGNVERALARVPGVRAANVNLTLKRAVVKAEPGGADPEAIAAAVREAGYGAKPLVVLDLARALEDDEGEARREKIELALAALCAIPVLVLDHVLHAHSSAALGAEAVLATLTVALAGRPFLAGAARALRHASANMDVLVAAGVVTALGWSWLALLSPGFHVADLSFEAAALLVVFVRTGKWLEGQARSRARSALRALLGREATTALVRDASGATREVARGELKPGDEIVVRTGETAAADGTILEGSSAFDESFLTGESIPRERPPGDLVPGGAVNVSRVVVLRATRTGEETALRRVARLVLDAQANKAPIQRFADAVARVFVPAVIALALATGLGWLAYGETGPVALARAVAVLVVACPCALGLATPIAVLVGSGAGLRLGILVRSAPALESLGRVRKVLFDKTGTLTRGKPVVIEASGRDEASLALGLSVLLSLEERSTHPLARALVLHARSARKDGSPELSSLDHEELAGSGVRATIDGKEALVGKRELFSQRNVSIPESLDLRASELESEGATVVHVSLGGEALALAALRDEPRPEAREAIERLRALGVRTAVLSGDREPAVAAIARALGIDQVRAGLSPEEKLGAVAHEKARSPEGELVAMVGDGINDAPALARADVGIALGGGTDVAKEAGDVVLTRDDLLDVPRSLELGRATLAKVRQNLFLAVVYNLVGLPLAAGLLRRFGLELGPAFAGLAMSLSSASVVVNALRLSRFGK
ncbi:cation-translocating P-type ATPase [bacterium]|nr:cation-translocating P-type ATPase [bacterium]